MTQSEERQEVSRGHTEECLQHLARELERHMPKGAKGAAKARQPVADFCGLEAKSVTRWMYGNGGLPKGEVLIKLMCFLDLVGYRVIELERMSQGRRGLFELIGYGILSGEAAAEALGYTQTSSLYVVLAGRAGTSDDKDQKMWDVWKSRREELETAKSAAKEKISIPLGAKNSPASTPPPAILQPEKREKRKDVRAGKLSAPCVEAALDIMDGLAKILEGLPPVADLPEVERGALLGRTETVLRLSVSLNALSSQILTIHRG